MLKPRKAVQLVPPYHPPLAGREGLRLDFNENTLGCSPRVVEHLRTLNANDLARYPEKRHVEETVANFFGVQPSELLLTNGVDEGIHLLCQTYLDQGDEAIIVVPTYSMYRIYMLAAGAELASIPSRTDFEFPWSELRSRINRRTRLIAIANPNNPTGTVVTNQSLVQLAADAPQAALLVDEAYFEFYGQSILSGLKKCPNLFIARTFSKAYGLAGMRIGALVGNADQMQAIRRVCSPYNVNTVALFCLPQALADRDYLEQYVRETLESRARLERRLEILGLAFWPSNANFVLIRVGATKEAAQFTDCMRARGVLVRDRSADYGCEGCVRVTLGPRDHTGKMLAALEQTLEEVGIAQGAIRP